MGNNVSQCDLECEVCHAWLETNELVPVQLCLDDYRYVSTLLQKDTFIGRSKKCFMGAITLYAITKVAYYLGKSSSDQLLNDKLWGSDQKIKSLTNSDKDFYCGLLCICL